MVLVAAAVEWVEVAAVVVAVGRPVGSRPWVLASASSLDGGDGDDDGTGDSDRKGRRASLTTPRE